MEKQKWYYGLLQVKQEEWKPVLLLMLFSFFVGLSLSFYFTASNAIFLKHFSSKIIALSYMASGVAVYLAWLLLSNMDRWLTIPQQLASKFIFVFITVSLISIWVWVYDTPASAFVMFTWIRVLVYITLITFWGMAGKLFHIRQGKRVFGLIGVGEVVSIIIGYFSIPFLLKILKSKDLLFLSSGGLLVCLVIALVILRLFKAQLSGASSTGKLNKTDRKGRGLRYTHLLRKPYFRLISLMAVLPIFAYLFVDFLFLDQTKQEFSANPEVISGFLGIFLGFTAFVELIFKLVSGRFLDRYGLKPSLIALPAVLLFSIGLASIFGTLYGTLGLFFALIAFARLFERAVRGSIYEPAFQLLYQPVQEDQRLAFQNQIEGIPKALGTIVTGGIIYLLFSLSALNLVHFNYFFIIILILWVLVSSNMYTEYRSLIRMKLAGVRHGQKPEAAEKPALPVDSGSKPLSVQAFGIEELALMVQSPEPLTRLQAAGHLARSGRYAALRLLQLLLKDKDPGVKKAALQAAGSVKRYELWSVIIENISNPAYGNTAMVAAINIGESILPEIRRYFSRFESNKETLLRVIRIYKEVGGEQAVTELKNMIFHPDKEIRFQGLMALSEVEYQASQTEASLIRQIIEEQAETMVWCMAAWFDTQYHELLQPLQTALDEEIEEKKESIFLLLSLVYDSKTIRHIRENIESKELKARIYALEVCDMTVSQDIKDLIFPLFEDSSLWEKLGIFNSRYPQQTLDVKSRLHDIINKDYGKINRWTKACALSVLHAFKPDNDPGTLQLLAANLVNPDLLIQETAARELQQINPGFLQETTRLLKADSRYTAARWVQPGQFPGMGSLPLIDKVIMLKASPLFSKLSHSAIIQPAAQCEYGNSVPRNAIALHITPAGSLWIDKETLSEILIGFQIEIPEGLLAGTRQNNEEIMLNSRI